jgi:hypothetical protein
VDGGDHIDGEFDIGANRVNHPKGFCGVAVIEMGRMENLKQVRIIRSCITRRSRDFVEGAEGVIV